MEISNLSPATNMAAVLAQWVKSAKTVDFYQKPDKEVYVASNDNEHLILTCHRADYPHGKSPHVVMVWVKDGRSEVITQDILHETSGRMMHSTGSLWGENLETVWLELHRRRELG